ncbi:LysE/ArgO family amino acid transporter [Paenibacillus hexagrammi]|uniref:LysE/ArgO family amino acid transporter n=1 Tax=Paenibacillus hexagrammi TaxID=2908839 RepID=A0ABY3SFZ7_9BACL|nr:LysE/ArgO family amino acid transporter [Paenibacillus sp. YPD9-1]UJF32958.1 LysE/ArgO family amino acid transporter [Paenibacillus sp. YPD9-1]
MVSVILHALILSIGLIMPLGVQNFFVFTQGAVRERKLHVLVIVIAASLCDTALITAAVLGVSVVVFSFVWMKLLLVIVGFVFLMYMGYGAWKTKPESSREVRRDAQIGKLVSFTVMVSLLNPHAILDTIGIIGTSSLQYQGVYRVAFTLTCVCVSWMWFFSLALAGRWLGLRDTSGRWLGYLNKISALVMWAAAVYLLSSLFE